jgi:DNA-binding CsgD family transcriptional regulator
MSAPRPPSAGSPHAEPRTRGAAVASGKSPNSSALAGRAKELERIDGLLDGAVFGHSGALLVTGEPGSGKTTLLDAAIARADSFTCVRTRGVEAESQLAHAGLFGLLNPIRDRLADIPAGQAAALGSALAWSSEVSTADPFLLGAATLSLFAAAAEHRPLLVVADDFQWLDPESAAAILFAARRLGPDSVAILLAVRDGAVSEELGRSLPVLPVGGLSVSEAAVLLPERAAPEVVERLVAGTMGNPLALLEVAARLNHAQWLGAANLPDPLPAGDRLREHFRTTLAELSPAARDTVLYLALVGDDGSAAPSIERVLDRGGIADEALQEAWRRGILVQEHTGYRIRHPLLRSAVLEGATAAEKREAHRALAAALPISDDTRIWHLAASTRGHDPLLADQLAALARSQRGRLGFATAATALERAAELSSDPDVARRRLALAADDAFQAGDVARVRVLAERVLADGVADRSRGEALFTLGMLEQYAGSVPQSVEYLDEASHLLEGRALVRDLTELALARFRLNDVPGMVDCGRRIDACADPDDAEQRLMASFTGGAALLLSGDLESGKARLTQVRRLADSPAVRHDARSLLLMALAAAFTGHVGDAVAVGGARLQEVRRRGAIGVLVPCLAILAAGKAWSGDHNGAYADAGEAADLARHLGYAADGSVAVEMLAWQSAARGLHDEAKRSLVRARELTDLAGTTRVAAHQAITSAYCALCRGDLHEMVDALEPRLAADGGVGASGEPLGVAPLLVEAYLGLGRKDDAQSLTARYAAATPAGSSPLSLALARRCEALTEPDESVAEAAFAIALTFHGEGGDPFETARTRLLYGGRLRRTGHRVAARSHLGAAHRAFVEMDLTHWVAVADRELAATGATTRRKPTTGSEPLTSQETRIAILAAQGLSNKEIGAALFLSPKTVERHLGNVFRKRGFRSRTELAVAYARSAPEGV